MKKLISLVAVFAIIAVSSLGAFAADVDVSKLVEVATELPKTGYLYEVEADSTAAYATIVAVKGSVIKVGAIQYLNQLPTTAGKATFSFALNDDLVEKASAVTEDTKVYVLTGGDGNIAVEGYIETKTDGPEMFTVSGSVVATIGKTLPVVKLTAADSTEYVATVTLNADNAQTADYTVSVPAGDYTFEITKGSHITYTSPLTVSAEKAIETITIYSGDTDVSSGINVDDFTAIGKNFGTSVSKNGESFVKAADTDDSDGINVDDFTAIGKNFGKSAAKDYAAIK